MHIICHRTKIAKTLETLDNFEFVLRKDTSEPISVHDHIIEGGKLAARGGSILEYLGGIHVIAKTKATTRPLSNGKLITRASDHLNLDTEGERIVDRFLGVCARGTEDGEETNELKPVAHSLVIIPIMLLIRNDKSTVTMGGELHNTSFEAVLKNINLIAGTEPKMILVIPLVTRFSPGLPDASSQ